MNFIKPALSILASSLLVIGIAQADQTNTNSPAAPAPAQQTHMGEHRMFNPAKMAQKHLEHLKSVLKITPDQESAWQAYADKVNAQVKKMADNRERNRHEYLDKNITTPERMQIIADNMKARAQDMEEMADATKMLYVKLSPEQRAEFDKTTEQEAQKFHDMMHHHADHAPMNTGTASSPDNNSPAGH